MPRIERSRTYIAEALLSLLKTRKYQDISINDIINKAGVSRMTFYRQFYDKKEVLKYILDTRTDAYIEKIKNDNSSMKERILQGTTALVNQKEFNKMIIDADLFDLVKEEFSKTITVGKDYYSSFIIGGLANIYHYYVTENRTETAEELANIIINTLDIEYLEKEIEKKKNK